MNLVYVFSGTGGGPDSASALLSVSICVGGRFVEGVVTPLQTARETYDAAVAKGLGASLVTGSGDVFRVELGKVLPGEIIEVFLTTSTPMKFVKKDEEQDYVLATIPLALDRRYSSAKKGEVSKSWDMFLATRGPSGTATSSVFQFESPTVEVRASFDFGSPLVSIDSPSHGGKTAVTITKDGASTYRVHLEESAPDTDLVIRMVLPDKHTSFVVRETFSKMNPLASERHGYGEFPAVFPDVKKSEALTTAISVSMRTSLVRKGSRFALAPPVHPAEVWIVADLSGSMSSAMRSLKEALTVLLASLPAGSVFNVVLFGSFYRVMFPTVVEYNDDTKDAAMQQVDALSANMGGTEIRKVVLVVVVVQVPGCPGEFFF